LACLFALLLLVVIAGFSYRSMNRLIEAFEWEQHSYKVLTQLEETLTTLVDAETGGRGFVITGNELFLEPFNRANRNLEREISELRQLTADNAVQGQRLDRLEQLANERMKRIQTGIELRRSQGLDAVIERAKTTQSTALMDSVRQLIAEMKS